MTGGLATPIQISAESLIFHVSKDVMGYLQRHKAVHAVNSGIGIV